MAPLVVHAADQSFVLDPEHRFDDAKISAIDGKLFLQMAKRTIQVPEITVTGRGGRRGPATAAG